MKEIYIIAVEDARTEIQKPYVSLDTLDISPEFVTDPQERFERSLSSWKHFGPELAPFQLSLHIIQAPDWMDEEYFIRNWDSIKYIWGFWGDKKKEWPKHWYESMYSWSPVLKYSGFKLLHTTKFRSEWRAFVQSKILTWLDKEPEDREEKVLSDSIEDQLCRYDILRAHTISRDISVWMTISFS